MTLTTRTLVLGASCVVILSVTAAAVALGSAPSTDSGDDAALSPAASDPVPSATAEVKESASAPPAAPTATPNSSPGPSPTAGPRSNATQSPAPAPSSAPTTAPLTGDLDEEGARDLVGGALLPVAEKSNGKKGEKGGLVRQLTDAVAGSYLAELEAQQDELTENGWTLEGDAVVDDVEIVSHRGREARVRACIDSSDVLVRDAEGDPVGSPDARSVRAANIFDLTREKGVWRITARSFADDPTC